MNPTIHLLNKQIKSDKLALSVLHTQLISVIDIQEKIEIINLIEELQSDILHYRYSKDILDGLDED